MIREFQTSDKEQICKLSEQINHDHHRNMPGDFRKPDGGGDWGHWGAFINDERGIFLVAEIEGEVVGFVACRIVESGKISFLVQKTKLHISTIVVKEVAQRNGIGRKLIESAVQTGAVLGATEVFLEVMSYNKGALRFYEALGFGRFSEKLSLHLQKPNNPLNNDASSGAR